MTLFRASHFPWLTTFSSTLCTLVLMSVIGPLRAQQPGGTALGTSPSPASGGWQSGETVHLIGLSEIGEKEKGLLSISQNGLTFVSPKSRASVQRAEILDVSVGDVTVETGGTAGKITRAIIPFGGGAAVATVSHLKQGLLTVEFLDQHSALHGAVFLLPKDEALKAQQQLGPQTSPHSIESLQGHCETSGGPLPDTIKVMGMSTLGSPVPAEYRVLIYEQIVRRLREENRFAAVYRDGDDEPSAACPRYTLVVTLDAFQKGNAAVRASTGPVGFFIGATKLKFHLQVQDISGRMVFDKELQTSKRGDTDSLDIADKIARTLIKKLKKHGIQAAQS